VPANAETYSDKHCARWRYYRTGFIACHSDGFEFFFHRDNLIRPLPPAIGCLVKKFRSRLMSESGGSPKNAKSMTIWKKIIFSLFALLICSILVAAQKNIPLAPRMFAEGRRHDNSAVPTARANGVARFSGRALGQEPTKDNLRWPFKKLVAELSSGKYSDKIRQKKPW
jgi:hypothetical protein